MEVNQNEKGALFINQGVGVLNTVYKFQKFERVFRIGLRGLGQAVKIVVVQAV